MTSSMRARRVQLRRRRAAGALVLAALTALVVALGLRSSPSAVSSVTSVATMLTPSRTSTSSAAAALGPAGGAIPDGTTIFDDAVPGVAKLDPELLVALRRAAGDAGGVRFVVDSGWRSAAYQEHLLQEAISEYGSEAEAARWVATPTTSAHVSGQAIDLGRDASAWLSAHGSAYGLCQIYDNEPWHFELRPEAAGQGCPARYADPTQDPRMQR